MIGKITMMQDKNQENVYYTKFIPADTNLPWFDVDQVHYVYLDQQIKGFRSTCMK